MSDRRSIIALVAVALLVACMASTAACGSSSSPTSVSSTPADVTVTIRGNLGTQSFTPSPIAMRVGQTIGWMNADTITHTATQDGNLFNTGSVTAGARSSPVKMNTAGTFSYHCSIHQGMVGTITVQ